MCNHLQKFQQMQQRSGVNHGLRLEVHNPATPHENLERDEVGPAIVLERDESSMSQEECAIIVVGEGYKQDVRDVLSTLYLPEVCACICLCHDAFALHAAETEACLGQSMQGFQQQRSS